MAKQLGVSPDMLGKILPVLAPLILGAITKNTRGVGRDPNSGGGIGDILGSVLGGAGGGDILGSVLGGAGAGGGAQQKAGCLSAILGGLLGGGKR
jgi:hypothetical protein